MTPEAIDFKDECDSIANLLDGYDDDVFADEGGAVKGAQIAADALMFEIEADGVDHA